MGPLVVVAFLPAWLLSIHAEAPRPERAHGFQLQVRARNAMAVEALQQAGRAAAERLADPGCARIFSDFTDADGRTLQQRLDERGLSPAAQLQGVYFYDGAQRGGCRRQRALAFTEPGSHVVFVCPQFAWRQRQDPKLAPVILIHELLHTLGLGENPPSSEAISRHVRARCGP
jgi:hypothetical protein